MHRYLRVCVCVSVYTHARARVVHVFMCGAVRCVVVLYVRMCVRVSMCVRACEYVRACVRVCALCGCQYTDATKKFHMLIWRKYLKRIQ